MADVSKNEGCGLSTTAVVFIGVGALAVGVVGTAAIYEMKVIPDALEAHKKGLPAGGLMGIQGGK